jgi:hypothetical protein
MFACSEERLLLVLVSVVIASWSKLRFVILLLFGLFVVMLMIIDRLTEFFLKKKLGLTSVNQVQCQTNPASYFLAFFLRGSYFLAGNQISVYKYNRVRPNSGRCKHAIRIV